MSALSKHNKPSSRHLRDIRDATRRAIRRSHERAGARLAYAQPSNCPQPRFTGKAPDDYYTRVSPLATSDDNSKAAEQLFLGRTRGADCSMCHGKSGDGKGPLANQYDPPPRNFARRRHAAAPGVEGRAGLATGGVPAHAGEVAVRSPQVRAGS